MAGKGSHRRPSQISREEEDRRWAEAFHQRPIPNERCPDCEGYGFFWEYPHDIQDEYESPEVLDTERRECTTCNGSGKRGSPDVG